MPTDPDPVSMCYGNALATAGQQKSSVAVIYDIRIDPSPVDVIEKIVVVLLNTG
jgi:hypothetical protein